MLCTEHNNQTPNINQYNYSIYVYFFLNRKIEWDYQIWNKLKFNRNRAQHTLICTFVHSGYWNFRKNIRSASPLLLYLYVLKLKSFGISWTDAFWSGCDSFHPKCSILDTCDTWISTKKKYLKIFSHPNNLAAIFNIHINYTSYSSIQYFISQYSTEQRKCK